MMIDAFGIFCYNLLYISISICVGYVHIFCEE